MSSRRRHRRASEAGRGTGCVLSVILCVIALCAGAFVTGRVLTAPDLGAGPQGPSDGSTATAIAAREALSLAAQLAHADHGVIVLTEQDLTVIAQDRNPDPSRYRNPEVLVRDGQLVIVATTSVGPFDVVANAHVSVALDVTGTGPPTIATSVSDYSLGREWVPGWIRSIVDSRGDGALAIDPLINDNAGLSSMRDLLECVDVTGTSVRLGFHRPDVSPDPTSCVPQQ